MEPAAIRYKNPGAQWPGRRATKWGSTEYVTLKDGQGNKIAVFPTFVQGAAAQFDLWNSNYTGMSLKDAIKKWSGHNSPASYVLFLEKNTGVSIHTEVTTELLASPTGWKLLKAQSRWEAGKAIPMTDDEWKQAQAMVFKDSPAPEVSPPFLRLGMAGTDVKKLQRLLGIKADGSFGKNTLKALMAFQEKAGLRDDGICGPLTWAALTSNH